MGGNPGRVITGIATGGLSEVVRSDVFKGLTGQKTSQEEKAIQAQIRAIHQSKKDAEKQLQDREERMKRKRQGRSSLLSGSELGIVQSEELSKTLG